LATLEKTAQGKKAPALVYEEYDLALRAIRDSFTEDVTKLIVDPSLNFTVSSILCVLS